MDTQLKCQRRVVDCIIIHSNHVYCVNTFTQRTTIDDATMEERGQVKKGTHARTRLFGYFIGRDTTLNINNTQVTGL